MAIIAIIVTILGNVAAAIVAMGVFDGGSGGGGDDDDDDIVNNGGAEEDVDHAQVAREALHLVGVGAALSYSMAEQSEIREHLRSEVSVAGVLSNSDRSAGVQPGHSGRWVRRLLSMQGHWQGD